MHIPNLARILAVVVLLAACDSPAPAPTADTSKDTTTDIGADSAASCHLPLSATSTVATCAAAADLERSHGCPGSVDSWTLRTGTCPNGMHWLRREGMEGHAWVCDSSDAVIGFQWWTDLCQVGKCCGMFYGAELPCNVAQSSDVTTVCSGN